MQISNVAVREGEGKVSAASLRHCSSIACILLLGVGFFAGAITVSTCLLYTSDAADE